MIRIRAARDRSPRTSTTSAVLGCGSMRWLARKGADILLQTLAERGTGTFSPKTTRREHLYPLIDAIFVGVCSACRPSSFSRTAARWSEVVPLQTAISFPETGCLAPSYGQRPILWSREHDG